MSAIPATIDLLQQALQQHPVPYWTEQLRLSRNALHTSKIRGHLSPAIAGALAERLGEDVDKWIVIAALESEKDSACKERMLKHAERWRRVWFTNRQKARLNRAFLLQAGMPRLVHAVHSALCR